MVDNSDIAISHSHIRKDRSRSPVHFSKIRLLLKNIPYSITWRDLKNIIRDKGNISKCFVSMYTIDGNPAGAAIVEVNSKHDAEVVIDVINEEIIDGRKIIAQFEGNNNQFAKMKGAVLENNTQTSSKRSTSSFRNREHDSDRTRDYTRDHSRDRGRHIVTSNSRDNGRDKARQPGNDIRHTTNSTFCPSLPEHLPNSIKDQGITIDMLNKLEITPEQVSTRIYVGNLQYDVDDQKVREVFTLAGEITQVEIKMDADNKSRGFGTVTFKMELHAVQAISMFNGISLNGREMRVRMDRVQNIRQSKIKLPEGLSGIGDGLGLKGLAAKNASDVVAASSRNENKQPTLHHRHAEDSKSRYSDYNSSFRFPENEYIRGEQRSSYPNCDMPEILGPMESHYARRDVRVDLEDHSFARRDSRRDRASFDGSRYCENESSLAMKDFTSEESYAMRRQHNDRVYQEDAGNLPFESHMDYGLDNGPVYPVKREFKDRRRYLDDRSEFRQDPYESNYTHNLDNIIRNLEVDQRENGGQRGGQREGQRGHRMNPRNHPMNSRKRLPSTTNSSRSLDYHPDINKDSSGYVSRAQALQTGDDSVIVTGLPSKITWLELKSKFCEVGNVRYAEIAKNNRSRGVVRFSTIADATKAVEQLDETTYLGSTLRVCLERDSR